MSNISMAAKSDIIYITYVEKHGAFLKLWGQTERNLPLIIDRTLKQISMQFDEGLFIPPVNHIQNDALFCAKYKDNMYYRARIVNISMLPQNLVEVHFIDFGNRDIVSISNLRTFAPFSPSFITIDSQAKEFILANVTHLGLSWDNDTVKLISRDIRYIELRCVTVSQVSSHTLVKLYKNNEDVGLSFCNKGIVLSIALSAQIMRLQNSTSGVSLPAYVGSSASKRNLIFSNKQIASAGSFTERHTQTNLITETNSAPGSLIIENKFDTSKRFESTQDINGAQETLLTYKANIIEPDTEIEVYISYVSDGPCQFSVQLQKEEDALAKLMNDLNSMNLQPLQDDPLPGTVCVARCIEDNHICRAVVTSLVDGKYKVFYVDFGNTELVPLDNLYQIPFKYVIPKVMAMRYALAGLEKSVVTLEQKCVFKEFVNDKLLIMRTIPSSTRSGLPRCKLRDTNNVDILNLLQKVAVLAYPEKIQLTRGFVQEVRVSYVRSCNHFYVQFKSKEEDLRRVMEDLQVACPKSPTLEVSKIKVGVPCCALFEIDRQWYRAEILDVETNQVKVRYVDYGNEELVSINNLRVAVGELLTALRPQAIECCLIGYQNMENDLQRDTILEELILENDFTMKVFEIQGNRALVELIDSARYNVGSLLLEKLAYARSQVSPILIQDSHCIEHRRRSNPTIQKCSTERKSSRDQNDKGWRTQRQDSNDNKQQSNDDNWGDQEGSDKGGNNKKTNFKDRQRSDERQDKWLDNKSDNARGDYKGDSWRQRKEDFGKDDNFDRNRGKRDGFKKPGFKNDSWDNDEFSRKSFSRNGTQRANEKDLSSPSEKSWRQSSHDKDVKVYKRKTEFEDNGHSSNFHSKGDWNNTKTVAKVNNPAPFTAIFTTPEVIGKTEKVLISWFHNPLHFFCQLEAMQAEFKSMMNEIQSVYSNILPGSAPVNAPIIALYPKDGALYRAQVLEVINATEYRVQYVDFGNISITTKIWPIENKFMKLPSQAISCSLNGILPINEDWPDPNEFADYFDKDFFMSTFISTDENKYLIDLTHEGSVSEALVSNGLAQYKEIELQNFDPSLLLGQQMFIVLGEVESLDHFYVYLQNDVQILCTMHNLEQATSTFEDKLTEFIDCALIMYVDNVLDEKTEVTLYDTTGTKLKILVPDEGAFETIEVLCAFPILYPTITGWVSFLLPSDTDKMKVYIQPVEYSNILGELLNSLYNHYNDITFDTSLEPQMYSYYAVHSSDENWYRGQIIAIEAETITVKYIDYGNSENVSSTQLRELEKEFKQQHMLALEVLVSDIDESFIEQEITVTVWYGEDGWEASIQTLDQTLTQKSEDVVKIEEHVTNINESPIVPEETPEVIQSLPNEQPNEQLNKIGVPVILSHIDSPNEFYLQLLEAIDTIDNLQATLQEQVDSFPILENPVAGVLCAAPYSLDQLWYRAQVLDADSDITTVRYVDYGNTDVLTNTTTHVKTLPPDLLSLEQHARRCSLIVKSVDTEWSALACELFEMLTCDKNVSAEIIHQDEKTTYIELYADGENVAHTFIQNGLAIELQLEIESSSTGYISHLNSPSEFWIQLENSVPDLEWIAEQLSVADQFPELEDLTPGSLCAALFIEDEMWYRARILSNTVAGLEVLFIDYGNSCTCSGLRQLPEDLIMLPALAQKCSLQKPNGILQWSTLATDEFKNISADGATIFTINKLTTGETSIVRLLLDGEDIAIKLLPKTEDVYITHFESISCFWLQKHEDMSKIESISDKLREAINWPTINEEYNSNYVAALSCDDNQWYRAQILNKNESDYEVLFIDFGNTCVVNDVHTLCDIEEAPLAHKCKIDALPGFRWTETTSEKLAEMIITNPVFQVEFVNSDTVRLYLNGNDVRLELEDTCILSVQSTPKKIMKTDNIDHMKSVSNLFTDNILTCEKESVIETNEHDLFINEKDNTEFITEGIDEDKIFTNNSLIEKTVDHDERLLEPTDIKDKENVSELIQYDGDFKNNSLSEQLLCHNEDQLIVSGKNEDDDFLNLDEDCIAPTDDKSEEIEDSSTSLLSNDLLTCEERSVTEINEHDNDDGNDNIDDGNDNNDDGNDNNDGIECVSKHIDEVKISANNSLTEQIIDFDKDSLVSIVDKNEESVRKEIEDERGVTNTIASEQVVCYEENQLIVTDKDKNEKSISENNNFSNNISIEQIVNCNENQDKIEKNVIDELETEKYNKELEEQTNEIKLKHEENRNGVEKLQRRSSTPHCDKIVPGAVCRGDLTEVGDNENTEVKIITVTNDVGQSEIKSLSQENTSIPSSNINETSVDNS